MSHFNEFSKKNVHENYEHFFTLFRVTTAIATCTCYSGSNCNFEFCD